MHITSKKIMTLKPLARNDELDYIKDYQDNGNMEARDKVLIHNYRFMYRCALSYRKRYSHVYIEDLKSYALMGAIKAMDTFDCSAGNKFISWAVWEIKASIKEGVENNESTVRMPANFHTKIRQEYNKKTMSDEGSIIESNIKGYVSFSSPINDMKSDLNIEDVLEDHDSDVSKSIIEKQKIEAVHKCISELQPNEITILTKLYGLDNGDAESMVSLSKQMGLKYDELKRIRDNTILKLQRKITTGMKLS